MKKHWLTIGFCLGVLISSAQPAILWQKTTGDSRDERVFSGEPTPEGGLILAGASSLFANHSSKYEDASNCWVAKINAAGETEWQKMYGGPLNETAAFAVATLDGGYIVAGYADVPEDDANSWEEDCLIIKLDHYGAIQWQKQLGGSGYEESRCIRQTKDGGYILAAFSTSNDGDVSGNHGKPDYWIVKLSPEGNLQWQKSYGGSDQDIPKSIQLTPDGGYLVSGNTLSNDGDISGNHGFSDTWVLKLSEKGAIQWQKTLGGSSADDAAHFLQNPDGSYIFCGGTSSSDGDTGNNRGDFDAWVIKLNTYGAVVWQKTWGGSLSDYWSQILPFGENGYLVLGTTTSNNFDVPSNHGNSDLVVAQLTEDGEPVWAKTFGGSKIELSTAILPQRDGNYTLVGTTSSNDGDVSGLLGGSDGWLLKLGGIGNENKLVLPDSTQATTLDLSPNPARAQVRVQAPTEETSLQISISDLSGRPMRAQTLQNGGDLDISTLPNGVFWVQAKGNSGKVYFGKLRKQG